MLEQIHAAAEDQRKMQVIVALGMVAFGVYALAGAAMGGWSALAVVGMLIGSGGAASLTWARTRAILAPKRFAH